MGEQRQVLNRRAVLAIHVTARALWGGVHAVYVRWMLFSPFSSASTATRAMFLALVVAVVATHIVLVRTPPVPHAAGDVAGAADGPECGKCRQGATSRGTKHCVYCDRCVPGWDHHCVFAGACVARSNHAAFWWYLLAQTAVVLPALHATIGCLDRRHSGLAWSSLSLGFLILVLIALSALLGIHTALGTLGLTTPDVTAVFRGRARAAALLPRNLACSAVLTNFARFVCGRPVTVRHNPSSSSRGGAAGSSDAAPPGSCMHALDVAWDNSHYSCC